MIQALLCRFTGVLQFFSSSDWNTEHDQSFVLEMVERIVVPPKTRKSEYNYTIFLVLQMGQFLPVAFERIHTFADTGP